MLAATRESACPVEKIVCLGVEPSCAQVVHISTASTMRKRLLGVEKSFPPTGGRLDVLPSLPNTTQKIFPKKIT